jgi:hypothetical protein
MPNTTKQYLRELLGSIAAYVVVLVISTQLLTNNIGGAALRPLVAFLPMLPAVLVIAAIIRHLRRIDELEQRIQLEALALAFMGTAFLTFSYGFLEIVGFPHISWFAVWPIMAVLWLLGVLVARRRYGGGSD